MHRLTYFFASVFATFFICAKDSNAQVFPLLQVGDTWSYRQTSEETGLPVQSISTPDFSLIFENKGGDLVLAMKNDRNKSVVAVWTPIGPVSPLACMFDVNAHHGIRKTCDIVLENGATWSSDESTPIARTQERFTVASNEDIVVPAGKFRAIKIEGQRIVTMITSPGVSAPKEGNMKQFRTTYWYSPDVKAMVKVIREIPMPSGSHLRLTEELESYVKNVPKQ